MGLAGNTQKMERSTTETQTETQK